MTKVLWAASLLALIGLSATASADPAYTKEDVLRRFLPRSSERGICVSAAAQQCGTVSSPKNVSFDLLVTFDKNSADLSSSAKENLLVFAEALKDPALASRDFLIEGHTDKTGPEEFNVELSKRRAEAVSHFLASKGVDTHRLQVRGVGWQMPRTPNETDPENRRVEAKPFNPA